jgi:hypothetical protein
MSATDIAQWIFPKKIPMPNCIRQLLEYTYPTVDWTTVTLHQGLPHILNWTASDKNAVTLPSFRSLNHVDIYFNKDKWQPCTRDGLGLIAHEGFHVLQMKNLMGGYSLGYIGLHAVRYFSCSLTQFLRGNDAYEDNDLEIEAYAFAGRNASVFDTCLQIAGPPLPCDCDCMPPSVNSAGMAHYKSTCPTIIAKSSSVDFSSYWGSLGDCIIGLEKLGQLARWFYSRLCKARTRQPILWLPCVLGLVLSLVTWIVYVIYYVVWLVVFLVVLAILEVLNILLAAGGLIVAGVVGLVEGIIEGVGDIFSSPSSHLWTTSYNSVQWDYPDVRLSPGDASKSSDSPRLASLGPLLYCAYKSSDGADIWYNVFDGMDWLAQDIKITKDGHTKTSAAPALAEFAGKLYMAYKASSGTEIWYNVFDGTDWLDEDIKISRGGKTRTSAGPGLARFAAKLYMTYKASSGSDIWYNIFDGNSWRDEDCRLSREGRYRSVRGPSLGQFATRLVLAYRDSS